MSPRTSLPGRTLRLLLAASVACLLAACAAQVIQQPTRFEAARTGADAIHRSPLRDTTLRLDSGYERVIRAGSRWKPMGRVAQGDVYAPVDSVFSIEGAHVHEAWLVVSRGRLTGFYLPVEKTFSPLHSDTAITLWNER